MSRRKSLPGARWRPDIATFDLDLAYRYEYGQLDELDTAIYATIKELSTKRPRAEIVEVRAEAFQMTKVDIAGNPNWKWLSKDEQFAFACSQARINGNAAMRTDDGLRVAMWQMKGDEAHIALKIGGAHYPLDERDSKGHFTTNAKEPDELEEDSEEDSEELDEFEDESEELEEESDYEELPVPVELSEIERIESRDKADYQDGSARVALENAPAGSSTLLPTEVAKPDVAPGLNEDPLADDDDKDEFHDEGGHLSYRPGWIKCHEQESQIIETLDYPQVAPEETETEFETLTRILGPDDADWLWGYKWGIAGSNQRTRSASSDKDRARATRLCSKIKKAYMKTPAGIVKERQAGEQILVHLPPLCSAVRQERRKYRSEQMWEQSQDDFVTTRALSERDTRLPLLGKPTPLQRSARSQLDVPPPVLAAGTNTRIT